MNSSIKNSVNKAVKKTGSFFGAFSRGTVSFFRILFLSSFKVAAASGKYSKFRGHDDCIILGNGPSLLKSVEDGLYGVGDSDCICVNLFCLSELFTKLKPSVYCIVDGAFFEPAREDRIRKAHDQFVECMNKVDWKMRIAIPSYSGKGGVIGRINNENIEFIRFNSTNVSGGRRFRNRMYDCRLGMPSCQTVMNFALGVAIVMGYRNVYLYGADHTWIKDAWVNDDNRVVLGDKHHYDKKDKGGVEVDYNYASLLRTTANAFESHYLLNENAVRKGVRIYNLTSDTLLDAYPRHIENK